MTDNQLDTPNIKLTPEQNTQVEAYQVKLANLLSEINNATKILRGTKTECDRAIKEKAYQEELLAGLTPKVEEKKKQIDAYNEEINNASTSLSKLQEEIKVKTTKQAELDSEYEARESSLVADEDEVDRREVKLNEKENSLQTNKDAFDAKVAKLKEVISTF